MIRIRQNDPAPDPQHWRQWFLSCYTVTVLGYQNQPEYANFKQLLEAPIADAQEVLMTRYRLDYYCMLQIEK